MGASQAAVLIEHLTHASFDLLPAAAFIAAVPGGDVVRVNRRAAELVEGDSLAGHRLWEHLRAAGGVPASGADPIEIALKHGRRVLDVEAVFRTSRSDVPVSVSIEPVDGPDGQPIATLTLCHATTRWEQAAAALRRSEQRLTVALSAGRLGAWEFDLHTRILTTSPQCKANHGYAAGDDLQADILPAIDADHRDAFRLAIDHAIESGGAFEIEVPHRWPDGSRHWLLIAGRVLDPGCMVGVTLDVTERRGAAEALIAADRGKDEFLAVLGHELRNPIAPILTAVTLLQKKGPADRELQKLRTTILRQTLQMSKLVDDLLDVGRIINGKLRLERRVVDLNAVVAQAIETCAPLIEQQRHTLLVTRADVPLHVDADYERMVQVVCNLLNNAAKYMADGGRIELSVHARDGHGVIRVRDEGVGLSPEMLGRIFHQFVQIDSSTCLSQGGLGVGLSIVRAIVELHGGTVEARSDGVDTGAEFTVTLPGTARA